MFYKIIYLMEILAAIIGIIVSIIGTGYFVHRRGLEKKEKTNKYYIDIEIDRIASELY